MDRNSLILEASLIAEPLAVSSDPSTYPSGNAARCDHLQGFNAVELILAEKRIAPHAQDQSN